jgi:hypothetical protein
MPNDRDLKIMREGIKHGLELYAWWKDGVQYVGTAAHPLEMVLKEVDAGLHDFPLGEM